MRFGPSKGNLALMTKSENIVPENVFLAVMLMHTSILHIVNQVVLEQNSRAALIGIQPPTAVTRGIHVVDDIISHHGALRRAERINSSHIAKNAVAQMMQVIILNSVPLCRTLVISPTPAYRNGRVIKVTHITMRNEVIRTLADPHTDGMRH